LQTRSTYEFAGRFNLKGEAGISQDRMANIRLKLVHVLVGDCEADPILANSENMFAKARVVKLWNSST